MLSEAIRIPSSLIAAPPADGGPPLAAGAAAPIPGERIGFEDVLKALNPLHHLPVVGTIYRAVTGETIQPAFRVLGGAAFGGVPGMLLAAVGALVEETAPGAEALALLRGGGAAPDAALLARAEAAYAGRNHAGA
jgi:hypothetical protein